MDYLKQFVIPFVGLSAGNHRFSFSVNDAFFDAFEYSQIKSANVKIDLDLNKMERMLVLNFSITGTIRATCDRCLDEFDLPVEGDEEFFVKFGDEFKEEDDNVMIIPESESHLDISPLIYDYLHLMVPYRVVHPDDAQGNSTCDTDIIKRITEIKAPEGQDARWEKLKDLNLE